MLAGLCQVFAAIPFLGKQAFFLAKHSVVAICWYQQAVAAISITGNYFLLPSVPKSHACIAPKASSMKKSAINTGKVRGSEAGARGMFVKSALAAGLLGDSWAREK